MRATIIVVAVLTLAGCVAIPPAVSIASWAINGVSYLASGKSVSDHAISAVLEQDCAMWRILKGDPICVEYPAEDGAVAVAENEQPATFEPFEDETEADREGASSAGQTMIALEALEPVWPEGERPELAAAAELSAPDFDSIIAGPPESGPTQATISVAAIDLAPTAGTADDDLLASLRPAAPVVPIVGASLGAWRLETVSNVHAAWEAAVAPRTSSDAIASTDVPALVLATAERPRAADARYVVIGSFRKSELAFRHAAQYGALEPIVLGSLIDGRPRNRVVTGPFPKAEVKAALLRAGEAGIEGAWVLRVPAETTPLAVAALD
jgi:hypothetical protein